MQEIWLPVPDWDEYEISSWGHVRNTKTGKTLKGWKTRAGYRMITLGGRSGKTYYVHHLVLEIFTESRPPGSITRHLDGNPDNNHIQNLIYGSDSENQFDAIRHGTHFNAGKTYCPSGHEYTTENTYIPPAGGVRVCRICAREAKRRYKQKLRRGKSPKC